MTWEGAGYRPMGIHCALAIMHFDHDFLISCKVSGKAYVGRRPHSFRNHIVDAKRLWQLQPKPSRHDLRAHIDDLENTVRVWNQHIAPIQPGPEQLAENVPSAQKVYGSINLHAGEVKLHMGDNLHEHSHLA